jgi:uncharacterized integral membrane protein
VSILRVLLFLVAALAVAILAGQNPVPLHLAFLTGHTTVAVSVVIILAAVLGAVCTAILMTPAQLSWRHVAHRLEAELKNRPVVAVSAPTTQGLEPDSVGTNSGSGSAKAKSHTTKLPS